MSQGARRGFTLVEFALVFALIGVFVLVMIPALVASREAARRVQCTNNLSQLAIGVMSYSHTNGMYPAGVLDDTAPQVSHAAPPRLGWIARVLPEFSQGNAYRKVHFEQAADAAMHQQLAKHPIAVLKCPSDSLALDAATSYAGCHHDLEAPIAPTNHGVFVLNGFVRPDDVQDGGPHTILLGEKLVAEPPAEPSWLCGTRASLRNMGTPPGMTAETGVSIEPGMETLWKGPDGMPIDPAQHPSLQLAQRGPLFVGGFGSAHPYGCNFAMCDGSVRNFAYSGDILVYQRLGHRADGQLPQEP